MSKIQFGCEDINLYLDQLQDRRKEQEKKKTKKNTTTFCTLDFILFVITIAILVITISAFSLSSIPFSYTQKSPFSLNTLHLSASLSTSFLSQRLKESSI
jgi:hypothetical protein